MTVDGQVYRKIGQFPAINEFRYKDLLSYTHFQPMSNSYYFVTYVFNKDSTGDYVTYSHLCCALTNRNIYYRKNSQNWNKGHQIVFAKIELGINLQSSENLLLEYSFMPITLLFDEITKGVLSWLYLINRKQFCMFLFKNNSSPVKGILFGRGQDRATFYFDYYDFDTSSKYSIGAMAGDIFNKTQIKNNMTLVTTQFNLCSSNNTIYKITVSNDGELITTKSSS